MIQEGEEELKFELYKEGELIEYESGENISDKGSYILYVSEDSIEYNNAYESLKKPSFAFEIYGETGYIKNSIISVPEGIEVSVINRNEIPLEIDKEQRHYVLPLDGKYNIIFNTPAGEKVVNFVKDSEAPKFTVDASKDNIATIEYESTDIVNCILYLGEELKSEGSWVYEVEGEGQYKLVVIDNAGNTTTKYFEITYGLNAGAIVAIILIVLLIVGIALLVKKFRSNVSVR